MRKGLSLANMMTLKSPETIFLLQTAYAYLHCAQHSELPTLTEVAKMLKNHSF